MTSDKAYLVLSNIDAANAQLVQSGIHFQKAAENVAQIIAAQKQMQDRVFTSLTNITNANSTVISNYSVSSHNAIEVQKTSYKALENTLSETLETTPNHNEKPGYTS